MWSFPMEQKQSTQPTSSTRACMHKLTLIATNTSYSVKSSTTKVTATLFTSMIPTSPQRPEGRDSDHAGDKLTHCSHTGYIIYLNGVPINWFLKKQNAIESSSFGSEFVALKTVMEKLRGLCYKLQMMGFEIDGPTYAFGDNMPVVKNTSAPCWICLEKEMQLYMLPCCPQGHCHW
jgi:hypothetical protein